MKLSKSVRKFFLYLLFVSIVLLGSAGSGNDISSQEKRPPGARRSELSLFSGSVVLLRQNRVSCGIDTEGSICYQFWNAPIGQGGIWPLGTWNGYIFNSGLQVAGINAPSAGAWANDTVGAFFFDASGSQPSGTGLTLLYDATEPEDLAEWPAEAVIPDDGIYDASYVGRAAISAQDTWVRYWDGDPGRIRNRQHPMGIEIVQRSHAWNYPNGNSDILYFVFEIRNVTDEPDFQLPNELTFFAGEDSLPDDGWPLEDFFVAFGADHDIGISNFDDFSTVVFPFEVTLSYSGGFEDPRFEYASEIFHLPFFRQSPGLVGAAILLTPGDDGSKTGLTFVTSMTRSAIGLRDPEDDRQLWRYLSGRLDPDQGDRRPNVPPEVDTANPATIERSTGDFHQEHADTRIAGSTGPFRLAAGESVPLVVALVFAATVETMPDGSPSGIVVDPDPNANPPGIPSFHPGFASARGCDISGLNCTDTRTAAENAVHPIERAAGWVSYGGPTPSGRAGGALEGPENRLPLFDAAGRSNFELVPGSLLWKTRLAREFARGGLAVLPAPPEPPPFSLVPGDGTVTVVWEPSPTDENGDPFWEVASDSLSAFFNPNYQRHDVRFYRIWRQVAGEEEFSVVAEHPLHDRPFLDYTCETVRTNEDVGVRRVLQAGDTVEVRSYAVGEICPLGTSPIERTWIVFNNGGPGRLPGAGVTRDEGSLEAVAGELESISFGTPNETAPFTWTDEGLYNNFTYRYAVTAVDVNSSYSGPISLESRPEPQDVIPRGEAGPGKSIHTVPDPYLGGSRFDSSAADRQLMFVNLPPRATVRIYSLGGILVRQLEHDDTEGGGSLAWDLRDLDNSQVASGVYFFHVATPGGDEKVGKFTVIMGGT